MLSLLFIATYIVRNYNNKKYVAYHFMLFMLLVTYISSIGVLSAATSELSKKEKICTPSNQKARRVRRVGMWAGLLVDVPLVNSILANIYLANTKKICE